MKVSRWLLKWQWVRAAGAMWLVSTLSACWMFGDETRHSVTRPSTSGDISTDEGGVGGESTPSIVHPEQPTLAELEVAVDYVTAREEFTRQWGVADEGIGAGLALGRFVAVDGEDVAPGQGVKVAVIDTGIDLGHWEFDSHRVHVQKVPGENINEQSSVWFHGTAVASLIVAQPQQLQDAVLQSSNFHGVAWGAELTMYPIRLGAADPSKPYEPISIAGLAANNEYFARNVQFVLDDTPNFTNMSFGFQGIIEDYSEADLRANFGQTIAVLAQHDVADKTVMVISAGNGHGYACIRGSSHCQGDSDAIHANNIDASSPTVMGGLPAYIPELRDHVVSAVAYDSSGAIASFSNRCGIAAKWCLGAPGVRLTAASSTKLLNQSYNRRYRLFSGTSAAAPMVTGSLALVKHWFRHQLSNTEVLARVYATARVTPDSVADHGGGCPDYLDLDGDPSQCELSSVFGRGKVDVGAATAPIGEIAVTTGTRVADGAVPIAISSIISGGPVGDAFHRALAGRHLAVFDTLGAPFWVTAEHFVSSPPTQLSVASMRRFAGGPMADAMLTFSNGLVGDDRYDEGGSVKLSTRSNHIRVGWMDAPTGTVYSHFGLARAAPILAVGRGPWRLAAVATPNTATPVTGLAVTWHSQPDEPFTLSAGVLREDDTAAGIRSTGAFGTMGASSMFVGATHSITWGAWTLAGATELGYISPSLTSGLIEGVEPFPSSAFRLLVSRQFGNRLRTTLSVAQPLRAEGGTFGMRIPTGRTADGMVQYSTTRASLKPSGRQLDIGAEVEAHLDDGVDLRFGARISRQPGHRAGHRADAQIRAGLRFTF